MGHSCHLFRRSPEQPLRFFTARIRR